MASTPKRQRVAAYAVILRDERILLSRLSPLVTSEELWTLPGGGLDHGENPRDAVIREIHEETGLAATVSDTARVYSAHMPSAWRGEGQWLAVRTGWPANAPVGFNGHWIAGRDHEEPLAEEEEVEPSSLPMPGLHHGSVTATPGDLQP